ncbi:hypothetical protein FPOAC1_003881 [Fusarium poae]|uniref:hypothetical protein n=1 Tax=Fusarium poae TaxID=36050 RepID=UPI001CEA0C51|nr:hypothetical protein FPOAC1_003881 [Fusarium poae]KAG8677853.1 hypothetical protein FPOAC1_003881 [Fusarium poae]
MAINNWLMRKSNPRLWFDWMLLRDNPYKPSLTQDLERISSQNLWQGSETGSTCRGRMQASRRILNATLSQEHAVVPGEKIQYPEIGAVSHSVHIVACFDVVPYSALAMQKVIVCFHAGFKTWYRSNHPR